MVSVCLGALDELLFHDSVFEGVDKCAKARGQSGAVQIYRRVLENWDWRTL